jgi:hypothetical protein
MTDIHLYAVTVNKPGEVCAGCRARLTVGTPAVLRNDNVLFCTDQCAKMHDGTFVDPTRTQGTK